MPIKYSSTLHLTDLHKSLSCILFADPFRFSEQRGEKVSSSASDSFRSKLSQPDVERDDNVMSPSIHDKLETQQKTGKCSSLYAQYLVHQVS